jgi:hypothetical protein
MRLTTERAKIMKRPQTSVREIEALLTAAMQARYPTMHHVELLRRRGRGWRCFVRYQLSADDKRIPPTEEAEAMLAELEEQYQIT